MFGLSWLWQSIVALILVIPAWLSIGFFEKTFHIRGEVTLIWYTLGMFLGSIILLKATNIIGKAELTPTMPFFAVLLTGIVLGSVANVLLFGAIPKAPNPGLPIAITSVATVFVFFLSSLMAKILPQYFSQVTITLPHFLGLILIIGGLLLILLTKQS